VRCLKGPVHAAKKFYAFSEAKGELRQLELVKRLGAHWIAKAWRAQASKTPSLLSRQVALLELVRKNNYSESVFFVIVLNRPPAPKRRQINL
jgi:hypothetical protein